MYRQQFGHLHAILLHKNKLQPHTNLGVVEMFFISKRMFFVSIKTEKNKNVRHCGTVTVRRSVQPALQISGQTAKYMREF